MRKYLQYRGVKGFTILELMISLVILTMLALFGGRLYLNYTNVARDLKAANLVYEEARFLMERIVREVRQNAIDYEQYFNQNVMIPYNEITYGESGSYGDNYCSYSSFFYDNNNESIGTRNIDQEFEYKTASEIDDTNAVNPVENELYLINISGDRRTMLTRVQKDVAGVDIGKVAMLKMVGKDFGDDNINGRDSYNGELLPSHADCKPDDRESDGLIDTWYCDPDYPCTTDELIFNLSQDLCEGYTHLIVNNPVDPDHSFVDISPNAINIVDLKFMIAPEDDPWKAYNMNDVQIQPHITIQLTAEANSKLVDTSTDSNIPSITLTSTITTRNYDEINSDCR